MNNLLLDEYPLLVFPSLAEKIGLNESIILQQVHYWLNKTNNKEDGNQWVYNTYDDWKKQFPFWSISTIRRAINNLENKGLLVTSNYNKMRADKTKWYTIDYKKIRGLNSPSVQNEQSICSKWTTPSVQNEQSNTRDYTETTTDIKDYSSKIKDLLSHFSSINNFEELNEEYWDVVKKTRATEKIQPSVIYKTMIKWTKQDNRIVEHALKTHIKKCKGKDEKYTLGIMRNTTLDEVEKSKGYREAVDF